MVIEPILERGRLVLVSVNCASQVSVDASQVYETGDNHPKVEHNKHRVERNKQLV